ncbi:hypothetical protein FDG2_0649 [Candidatus Protofrankia californiensis]|uniref:Uncharacterized protein n=1 Tax=Candidatus Protofrankia californiensis TaxID=1839754 RepID=A0A1C3NU14_9ACTN|nr:hypothetical protein FDG2_0649 [Candidatus Protofrankia californiensis]
MPIRCVREVRVPGSLEAQSNAIMLLACRRRPKSHPESRPATAGVCPVTLTQAVSVSGMEVNFGTFHPRPAWRPV